MIPQTPLEASRLVHTYGQPTHFGDYDGDESDEFDFAPRDYRQGVVSDHVLAASELDGVRLVTGALVDYVVDDAAGGLAWPVLCSEVIEILTEDGRSDGRCGLLAVDREFAACKGHAAELRAWRALTEQERAAWERQHA